MNGQAGIDHTGTWTARQYANDAGWWRESIEQTAAKGIDSETAADLTHSQQEELLEYCKNFLQDLREKEDAGL